MARYVDDPPARWQQLPLARVLTPDANGASFDPNASLSGPIVAPSTGPLGSRFQMPMNAGLAIQTDAAQGAGMLFDFLGNDGLPVSNVPRAMRFELAWNAIPTASSGWCMGVGYVEDATLTNWAACAVDMTLATPRARAMWTAGFGVGAADALGVDVAWGPNERSGVNGTTQVLEDAASSFVTMRDAAGNRIRFATKSTATFLPYAAPKLMVFAVPLLATPPAETLDFTVRAFYAENPNGEHP